MKITFNKVSLLGLGLTVLACSDNKQHEPAAGTRPAYVASTVVFSPEGPKGYIVPLNALNPSTTVELSKGLELSGRSLLFGVEGSPEFFVVSDAAPEVTKWSFNSRGDFIKGATFSFAALGVTSLLGMPVRVLSAEEGVAVDAAGGKLIRWDPSTMTIIESLPLEGLAFDGLVPQPDAPDPYFKGFSEVGGHQAFAFYYFDAESAKIPAQTLVILYDSATHKASVQKDSRCSASKLVRGADGQLYLASNDYVAAVHRLAPMSAPAPCVLRLRGDSRVLDKDYFVSLNTLTGGPTGTLMGDGNGAYYVRVYDESKVAVAADADYSALVGAAAWATYRVTGLETGTPAATAVSALGHGASRTVFSLVEGRLLFARFSAGFAETEWFDLSDSNPTVVFKSSGANVALLKLQ